MYEEITALLDEFDQRISCAEKQADKRQMEFREQAARVSGIVMPIFEDIHKMLTEHHHVSMYQGNLNEEEGSYFVKLTVVPKFTGKFTKPQHDSPPSISFILKDSTGIVVVETQLQCGDDPVDCNRSICAGGVSIVQVDDLDRSFVERNVRGFLSVLLEKV